MQTALHAMLGGQHASGVLSHWWLW